MKKRTLIFLAIIVIITVVYGLINYSAKAYKNIHHTTESYFNDDIFTQIALKRIIILNVYGNKQDTLYRLKLNNYEALVWKIQKPNELDDFYISTNYSKWKNRSFYFLPYTDQHIGSILNLKYRLPIKFKDHISLNINQNDLFKDTFNNNHYKVYFIRSNKFGVGNHSERSKIIFDFENQEKELLLFLFNSESSLQIYMMVFYNSSKQEIDPEYILNLINTNFK